MKIPELDGKRKGTVTGSSLPPGKAVMSVYVDVDVRDQLDDIAHTERVSRSDLIRHIIGKFVEDYNEENSTKKEEA